MIERLDLDRLQTAVEFAELDHGRVQLEAGMARLLLERVHDLEVVIRSAIVRCGRCWGRAGQTVENDLRAALGQEPL